MFDELAAAGLHPGDPSSASCCGPRAVLHDIGMTVDYDDHHKHSRYLILNGGLPGLHAARGRADRPGRPLPPQGHAVFGPFGPLMAKGDDELLTRISTLLRLAEDLERPRDQLVRAAHAHVEDGTVELRLETDGDASVSRWAAAREQDLFARSFWPRACRGVR